ncbi:uncharacterized protein LOC128241561 [Mya arenaria]|uniref:uncharacterized protein LOC128241561 n=1 Tax=Mya arenaria TaxID=6604 RepID=UPI0022E4BE9C|nr:uncharacterized protein LOC128241561 [Mya arenaria]
MDLRMFAACLIMTVFLIKHSDAQPTAWTFTSNAGTDVTNTGTPPVGTVTLTIAEGFPVGTTLFTAVATPTTGGAAMAYEFESDGNPNNVAETTITAGEVKLASGKSLDFETTPSIVFKIKATEAANAANTGIATVTLTVTDAIVFGQSSYIVCLSSTEVAAGTSIGTFATTDATSTQTVAYTSTSGNDFAKFTVTSGTGAVVVASGVTLKSEEGWTYSFTITGTAGGVTGTTDVSVGLGCASGAGQIASLLGILLLSVVTSLLC